MIRAESIYAVAVSLSSIIDHTPRAAGDEIIDKSATTAGPIFILGAICKPRNSKAMPRANVLRS